MTRIDQSDLYRRNSVVFKNFVLYSPDPPSAFTEGLGTRLLLPVVSKGGAIIGSGVTWHFQTQLNSPLYGAGYKHFCLGLTSLYSARMYSHTVSAMGINDYCSHDTDTIELFLAHLHMQWSKSRLPSSITCSGVNSYLKPT